MIFYDLFEGIFPLFFFPLLPFDIQNTRGDVLVRYFVTLFCFLALSEGIDGYHSREFVSGAWHEAPSWTWSFS
jgi:hypothetical protein